MDFSRFSVRCFISTPHIANFAGRTLLYRMNFCQNKGTNSMNNFAYGVQILGGWRVKRKMVMQRIVEILLIIWSGWSKMVYTNQEPDDQITWWVDHVDVTRGYAILDYSGGNLRYPMSTLPVLLERALCVSGAICGRKHGGSNWFSSQTDFSCAICGSILGFNNDFVPAINTRG